MSLSLRGLMDSACRQIAKREILSDFSVQVWSVWVLCLVGDTSKEHHAERSNDILASPLCTFICVNNLR